MKCLRRIDGFKRAIALVFACGLATGCATGRDTVDLKAIDSVNPASGPEVKLARVTDRRVFQVDPPRPSMPSLMDDQIGIAAITSRAIARKRNTYGMALGDILLPEGRTVEQITSDVLSRGLRESGYRVLESGEPGYDEAVPLEVDIQQFWAWMDPGFWAITLEFDSRILVSGPIAPFDKGESFRGHASSQSGAAFSDDWLAVMKKGLQSLNADIRSRKLLQSTAGPEGSAPAKPDAGYVIALISYSQPDRIREWSDSELTNPSPPVRWQRTEKVEKVSADATRKVAKSPLSRHTRRGATIPPD